MSSPLHLQTEIRCGVAIGGRSRDLVLDSARAAEQLGFDSVWVGDHIAFHVPILESLTLAAFLAAATERVMIGTAVYLMPLRPPVQTAKMTSTVDLLSGGRLTLGIGVGGEYPPEFEASGVPLRERGSRTDESIDIVRRLWTEDKVAHRGAHFEFGPISIDPKPIQPGGPPIWIGGRRPPALRRAGRLGDGYVSHMTAPDTYRANLETIGEHARDAGRPEQSFATAAFLFAILDDRFESALDRAEKILSAMYQVPFREAAPKYCLLGRPEDCLEQLRRFADAGCRHFILAPLGNARETVETIAREMLPEIRNFTR